jgi:ribosomal-protein-alanine N-acetyltransferase
MRRSFEEGHIQTFAVKECFRKQGIGSALMENAAEKALPLGIEVLLLEVRQGNREAMALYHKHGFFVDGYRKDFYRDPSEDAILMRKKLR